MNHEQINFKGIVITVLAIFALAYFVDIGELQTYILGAGIWGPLIFIALKISTVVVAPLSGSPLYPLVGLIFGFWPGILYVFIGDLIGHTIAFFIARKLGQKAVSRLIAQNETGLLSKIVAHASTPKGFFHMAIVGLATPEVVSYGAGLTQIPYRKFIPIIMTLLLIISSTLVFFGSRLDVSNKSLLLSVGLPIVGLGIMFAGGYLFYKGIKK